MGDMKHTPGPWQLSQDGRTIYGPPDGTGRAELIASVSTHNEFFGGPNQTEKSANARLIVAAPTMYSYIERKAKAGDAEAQEILRSL